MSKADKVAIIRAYIAAEVLNQSDEMDHLAKLWWLHFRTRIPA